MGILTSTRLKCYSTEQCVASPICLKYTCMYLVSWDRTQDIPGPRGTLAASVHKDSLAWCLVKILTEIDVDLYNVEVPCNTIPPVIVIKMFDAVEYDFIFVSASCLTQRLINNLLTSFKEILTIHRLQWR